MFSIEDGAVLAYSFLVSADVKIDEGIGRADPSKDLGEALTGRMTPVSMTSKGVLRLRFYGDGAAGWSVAGRIADPAFAVNGEPADYVRDAERPFVFHMSRRGRIEDLRFSIGTEEKTQALIRGLVYGMQTILPDRDGSIWAAVEGDGNGRFEAAYAVESSKNGETTIRKDKRGYLQLSSSFQGLPALSTFRIDVEKSETRTTFTPAGWVLEAHGVEDLVFASREKVWSRSSRRLEVKTLGKEAGGGFPQTFSEVEAELHSPKYVDEMFTRTDPELDRLGAGMDTNDAISEFRKLTAAGDARGAEKFMVNYLRQHREKAAELLRLMDADPEQVRIDKATQLILWRLVVEAGHPEAQRAVIEAVMDPSYGRGSHIRGLLYVPEFENPEPFLVEELWRLYRDPGLNGDPEISAETENMSIFAVGGLGYRDKLNEEIKTLAAESLLENLKNAGGDSKEAALTLKAIGNTGNDGILGEVSPYLSDPDASIRAAACQALRRMQAPKAQEEVITTYRRDDSEKVREQALKALKEMPLTSSSAAWVREELPGTEPVKEQVMLVELLGKTLSKYPANEEAMRSMLAKNPPLPVKETIYRFIAPK